MVEDERYNPFTQSYDSWSDKPSTILTPYSKDKMTRYRVLQRKPIMELSPDERLEFFQLEAYFAEQKRNKILGNQQEIKKKQETEKQARQNWVTSGNTQERFFKFMNDCMRKFVFQNIHKIGDVAVNTTSSSQKIFNNLVTEYDLESFFSFFDKKKKKNMRMIR